MLTFILCLDKLSIHPKIPHFHLHYIKNPKSSPTIFEFIIRYFPSLFWTYTQIRSYLLPCEHSCCQIHKWEPTFLNNNWLKGALILIKWFTKIIFRIVKAKWYSWFFGFTARMQESICPIFFKFLEFYRWHLKFAWCLSVINLVCYFL